MVRLVGLLALVLVIAAIAGIVLGIKALRDRAKHRRLDSTQRELAVYAPAVLKGDPLLDIVLAQGKLLKDGNDVIQRILGDSTEVFMPETHRTALQQWVNAHNDWKETK